MISVNSPKFGNKKAIFKKDGNSDDVVGGKTVSKENDALIKIQKIVLIQRQFRQFLKLKKRSKPENKKVIYDFTIRTF
jgi:hypothetical protein